MQDIRLVHLADVHLGYTGSISLVFGENEQAAGRYVREVDIENALERLTKDIIAQQPPVDVVVIAGDLFHRSAPLPRAIRSAARFVRRLVQYNIEVVIIDGNHETSSWLHTGSPTSFLRELGAHVVNGVKYEIVRDNKWSSIRLQNHLAVHALPYRAVLEKEFTGVSPITGYKNVLLTHGRVQGMDELNSLGLKAARIPPELLRQGWDYVALGDWHIHRYQALKDAPAYYAGSIEALNYGEAADYPLREGDPNQVRGAIDVRLSEGKPAVLDTLPNTGKRPVFRLEAIDATDLEPEAIMEALRQRLDSAMPPEALSLLEIKDCPLEVWQGLDHAEIERLRKLIRRCDIRPIIKRPADAGQSLESASKVSLDDQWEVFLSNAVTDENERSWYLQQGVKRIEAAREHIMSLRSHTGEG